jgi:4-amino-4-deoxy-L-arabinose transferase-like glycosyltransferase
MAPATPRAPSWGEHATAAACALVALLVYLRTLPPTVTGEDSGELVVAAYTLGIPHPPGYPLWCLLAHAFTYLPFGTVAWRVTLASAVFAAATVFVTGLIVARLTGRRAAIVAAALGLAFSRELWEQASIAEVYSLNALFTSVCLLLLLRWYHERRDALLYVFAIVVGFGTGVHHTMLVLAVAFAAFVVAIDHDARAWRRVYPRCVLLALLPLAVYAYLPIRSAADPPIDWGDPETWSRFWAVVSRRQYAYLWTRYPRTLAHFVALVGEFLRQ